MIPGRAEPWRSPPRIWFYGPELYWHGWSTLLPIRRGGDEFSRWTLMLGWSITGRVVIALWRYHGERAA